MRYNPETERGIDIDEIAAQCKAAIMRSAPKSEQELYNEVLEFCRWEHDVLIPV